MTSKIPIFLSLPTHLDDGQKKTRDELINFLEDEKLEARTLGQSDYPSSLPLQEVAIIASHCAGGIILGFSQIVAKSVIVRPAKTLNRSKDPLKVVDRKFPSDWNNLEAGILFALGKPLMVLREEGIEGGIFDIGVTEVFLHDLPVGGWKGEHKNIQSALKNWAGLVRENYRNWRTS